MARRDWSTANFLRCSSAVVTAVPLSVSIWGKSSITASTQVMAIIASTSGSDDRFMCYLSGATPVAATFQGATSGGATATATITANTWFHYGAVYTSANARACFLNGANKGTETTAVTPAGLARTSIGVADIIAGPAAPFAPAGTGDLAEVAMWNVALADADMASLALGIHPFLVRPDKLVAYWDLLGYNSPETNRKSNTATMAIQGSLSQSPHPRIFNPSIGVTRRFTGDVRVPLGRTPPRIFRPGSRPTRGLTPTTAFPDNPALVAIARSVGRTPPRIFRPAAGPTRGLTPTFAYPAISGSTFGQIVNAVATGTVTLVKSAGKTVAATGSGTTTLVRSIAKSVAMTGTGTVSLVKSVGGTIRATCSGGVTFVKSAGKVIAASAAIATTKTVGVGKVVATTGTGTVTLARVMTKTVAVAGLGAVTAVKAVSRTIAVTGAGTVAAIKQVSKSLSVTGTGLVALAATFFAAISGFVPNISMRSGFLAKPGDLTREWNGLIVRRSELDRRNPQDFVRAIVDRQGVHDPRPEPADDFLAVGDVTEDDL